MNICGTILNFYSVTPNGGFVNEYFQFNRRTEGQLGGFVLMPLGIYITVKYPNSFVDNT
jgi:hypothetical protein